jgi:hypothetical protein
MGMYVGWGSVLHQPTWSLMCRFAMRMVLSATSTQGFQAVTTCVHVLIADSCMLKCLRNVCNACFIHKTHMASHGAWHRLFCSSRALQENTCGRPRCWLLLLQSAAMGICWHGHVQSSRDEGRSDEGHKHGDRCRDAALVAERLAAGFPQRLRYIDAALLSETAAHTSSA